MLSNQLERARAIDLPTREAMLQRAPSVQQFWDNNKGLFSEAWKGWEASAEGSQLGFDDSLLDARLREAVREAWQDPEKEIAVKDLLEEISPGVFKFQFFDAERLAELRDYLEAVSNAQIPLRPPYGIVLNRGGAMLDSRSEGYLAAPSFQAFYRDLLDSYMRPIARLLFPEIMGYDTQTFGFSIQYQANKDTSLRLHTDASSVTLNININMPDEEFSGSELNFYDPATGKMNETTFTPGVAMIHRGNVAHAALPITSGERSNLVLWLYGDRGQIPHHNSSLEPINAHQRWTIPTAVHDNFAPF
ncbi:2OG-Fe(II) oxygenase [Vibrio cyclitrophicus ZF65]|uniref:2OG-Fe(II) oxygenase n=1 Tax=Vibrio cyclitrophicus TaxID=47951 RepID=UPI0002F3E6F0|nr:2OG-Fe(II) oxygenase [Vibrio cyclitrophicus]OED80839.1 2OG-Fe(II) oxygenase [Vibrio cyclitrophicus ZF65]